MDHFEDELGDDIQIVSLDGDPEHIAYRLLAPSLWRVPLDQIDLSTEQGQAELFARFIAGQGKASLEKDEIIRFTERNRNSLPLYIDEMLPRMAEAMRLTEGGDNLAFVIEYFLEQVRHAYLRAYDKIDVRSDRFFWLLYVLALQLGDRKIDYDTALSYIQKPEHKQRISPVTLKFMLYDYAESIEQPNQPPTEMLMLVGEAARMIDNNRAAHAAFGVILKIGTANNPENLLRYVNNMQLYLAKAGLLQQEDQQQITRLKTRYGTAISPDDF